MNNETPIRDTLLDVEPLSPQMHQRFEQQVRDIVDAKLTKSARLYWRLFLAASLIGAGGSAFGLVFGPHNGGTVWVKLFGLIVWSAVSVLCARILTRGRVDSRVQLAAGKIMPGVVWLAVMAAFAYGVSDPAHRPDATFYGIYALALFALVSSINLWNRIVAADCHAQEHALRLEYRLTDLASRLPQSGPASSGPAPAEPPH
jgi:hypothetical protein